MPSKQKKSTASRETEELDDEVKETVPKLKEQSNGVTGEDTTKGDKTHKKHKTDDQSENQEASVKEKKKDREKEKKKKKKVPDNDCGPVIENEDEAGEQNNNDPKPISKKDKSENHKGEVTEGAKEEKRKKKKKSSSEDPEAEQEMGSKNKKSKDGKKKKKSHSDDDEEPLIEEQEEEENNKKKKKKKAKKGSAESDDDKKKKGKKSKSKQVDYAAIYQKELLDYHTDSSDGYEDDYYKKKGTLLSARVSYVSYAP